MRAIDTNIVVRYLTKDDAAQAERTRRLIEREDVAVSLSVLLEAEWVLRAVYEYSAIEVIRALRAFCGLPRVTLEDGELASLAFEWAERGMDFADALHLASARSREGLVSFDKSLARIARRLGAPAVTEP